MQVSGISTAGNAGRPRRRFGLLVAVALAVVGSLLVVTPPTAAQVPPPSLTVTPSTDLLDGQVIQVDGTGFLPSSTVYLVLCPEGATSAADCDMGPFPPSVATDAAGSFSTSFAVRRFIVSAGVTVDCAQSPCSLGVGDIGETRTAVAPLGFADAPSVEPTLTVGPADATGAVPLVVSGFLPLGGVMLEQCGPAGTTAAGCTQLVFLDLDGAGTVSARRRVARELLDAGPSGPTTVDCTVESCSLRVRGTDPWGGAASASAPLDLAAVASPAISVAAAPQGPVADLDAVTLTATGVGAGALVVVRRCASTPDLFEGCPLEQASAVRADPTGRAEVTVQVRRDVMVRDGTSYRAVDCALAPACAFVIETEDALGMQRRATVPVHVTAEPRPAIAPVLTVEVVAGASDRVVIHGEGFPLGGRYAVVVCSESTSQCADLPTDDDPLLIAPDASGSFSVTNDIDLLPVGLGVSCVSGTCYLAASIGGFDVARSATFAPSLPELTVSILDAGTLDRGTGEAVVRAWVECTVPTPVSVRGHVRQPGVDGSFTLEDEACAPGEPLQVFIPTRSYDVRDARLALGPAEVEVLAVAWESFEEGAATSTTATVALVDVDEVVAAISVALADPANVALREEVWEAILTRLRQDPVFGWELFTGGGDPAVTVSQTTDLVTGQVVRVTGARFLPRSTIAGVLCPATVLDGRICDYGGTLPPLTTAHPDGRFTLDVPVRRVITYRDGGVPTTVDCAVVPCVLAVGDPGGARVVRVPLSFAP